MQDYFTNSKAPTLVATYNASIAASATITLNAGTTSVRVSAIGAGIFLKWGGVASSSSFDEFIALNATNIYIVPSGTTTVQFIQESATAKLVVLEK